MAQFLYIIMLAYVFKLMSEDGIPDNKELVLNLFLAVVWPVLVVCLLIMTEEQKERFLG